MPRSVDHAAADDQQFFALTPEKVLDAVERSGLRCRPVCRPLNSFENRVYEVELADDERGDRPLVADRRVVAKFYRPGRWSAEQIREEHALLAELAAEEVPVVPALPLPSAIDEHDHDTVAWIDGIFYSLWRRHGGRAPDELGDALIERLGMYVGRMHAVGARRRFEHRPAIDVDRYVRRPLALLLEGDWIRPGYRQRYASAVEELADLAERALEGVETQRIHGDLHLGNVLLRDGVLLILDFDDAATGPPVQDLWLALPGRDADAGRRREIFLAGYERFRAFDRSTLQLIEPLRAMRMVRYAGWIARRWEDPSFRHGWPHFGTEDYWLTETRDMEEQLAFVRAAARQASRSSRAEPPSAASSLGLGASGDDGIDPSELTNADYFWDWDDR